MHILTPPEPGAKLLEWAQWFIDAFDVKVMPISGKKPLIMNWKSLASKFIADFDWEHATGYGVLLDEFTVVDCDTKEVDILAEAMPWLPETLTVATPSGWHFYYKGRIKQKFSLRPESPIDILHGGLIVGPGSLHPIASERHKLSVYYDIDWRVSSLTIAEVPHKLRELADERPGLKVLKPNPSDGLKQKVKIGMLYKHYGGVSKLDPNFKEERLVRCIMPEHEDLHPSMSINNTTGLFYCHACQIQGDQISLIKLIENIEDAAAFNKLRSFAGITVPDLSWMKDTGNRSWGNRLAEVQPRHPDTKEPFLLWDELPVLSFIRDVALSSLISPQGFLGACLTMAASVVGPTWMLPPLRGFGNRSPLNMHVTIVGEAGSGKTSITSALDEAFIWPEQPLTNLGLAWADNEFKFVSRRGKSPPTGPGFRGAFGDREAKAKPREHTRAGLWFYYDEARTLIERLGAKEHSLNAVLRTAWSGSGLSSLTSTDELQADIPGWAYSYGILANSHIESTSHDLLDTSSGEGDGDRWIALAAHDPLEGWEDIPIPSEPWRVKLWKGTAPSPMRGDYPIISPTRYIVGIDKSITHQLVLQQISQRRGNERIGPLEGQHFNLLRLRLAALLALLDQLPPYITKKLWIIAGSVMDLSVQVRTLTLRAHMTAESKQRHDRAIKRADFVITTKSVERRRDRMVEVVARRMAAAVHRRKRRLTTGELCQAIGGDYNRWQDIGGTNETLRQLSIEHAVGSRWIQHSGRTKGGKGTDWWMPGPITPPDKIAPLSDSELV